MTRARLVQTPIWTFAGRVIKPGVMLIVHLPEVDYPGYDEDGGYHREPHVVVAKVIFSLSSGVRLKIVKVLEPADSADSIDIFPGRVMRFRYTKWKWEPLLPAHLLGRGIQIAWATHKKEK